MQRETLEWIILISVILLMPVIDLLSGMPLNAFGIEPDNKDE
ncbi:MAG: hypothetical protein WC365_00505 [Candidatus Babeliales bacterium]|jgi:hypothetical protein